LDDPAVHFRRFQFTLRWAITAITCCAIGLGIWHATDHIPRRITPEEATKIQIGMTQRQVEWILDRPHRSFVTKSSKNLEFDFATQTGESSGYLELTLNSGGLVIGKSDENLSYGGLDGCYIDIERIEEIRSSIKPKSHNVTDPQKSSR
jgi:hypothetical protein